MQEFTRSGLANVVSIGVVVTALGVYAGLGLRPANRVLALMTGKPLADLEGGEPKDPPTSVAFPTVLVVREIVN